MFVFNGSAFSWLFQVLLFASLPFPQPPPAFPGERIGFGAEERNAF